MARIKFEFVANAQGKLGIAWHCPSCTHIRRIPTPDIPFLCFMAVRHLAEKHSMSGEDILLRDPAMADAVQEYFGIASV